MSTFDGKVAEFPDIRIDYFRAEPHSRPPLAYFLSHVHSDHLVGLESCKSPFIYCTPATRDILLRLEKYPHRMNFARGVLETRTQTYRHLKNLLKAIPLETPTTIELAPGRKLRVTLFDANHCVGGCMFLIQDNEKAILYTGDIRSEAWWVDSLVRNPMLLPYACPSNAEPMKRLDCIYLDTTFVVSGREDAYCDFASKAQGINELLRKVSRYPTGTKFYFDSWTFGYEDVWQALSQALDAQVHVDDYRYGLYLALINGAEPKAHEGRQMIGYNVGNHLQEGYLTTGSTRLHSCEKGTNCEIWNQDFVRITPIISRYQDTEIAELGAGGGQYDLNQRHELQFWNSEDLGKLMAFCATKLGGQAQLLSGVLELLTSVISDDFNALKLHNFTSIAQTRMTQPDEIGYADLDGMPLEKLVPALAKLATSENLKKNPASGINGRSPDKSNMRADGFPKQITFPYSRHSSYLELCLLIEAFKPKDIFPCTVDERKWTPSCSMSILFGDIYRFTPRFRHDEQMLRKHTRGDEAIVVDSRPASMDNASSAYVTPNETHSKIHDIFVNIDRNRKRGSAERSGSGSDSKRRKGTERRVHGDFWPPQEVDHYSTPGEQPETRIRRPSASIADKIVDPKPRAEDLDNDETAPRFPISYRGQVLLAQPKPHEDLNGRSPRWSEERQQRRTLEYDRLSPRDDQLDSQKDHPVEQSDQSPLNSKAAALIQVGAFEKLEHPQKRSLEYGRLSPPSNASSARVDKDVSSTSITEPHSPLSRPVRGSSVTMKSHGLSPTAEQRLAFRQEAYNAVLGVCGSTWNDIGLVSVSGHQMQEELL